MTPKETKSRLYENDTYDGASEQRLGSSAEYGLRSVTSTTQSNPDAGTGSPLQPPLGRCGMQREVTETYDTLIGWYDANLERKRMKLISAPQMTAFFHRQIQ